MAAATATHRCSHCSRDFGRAEHLRRHERTHTNEKPYICDICPAAYSRRDLLKRHEIKAHNISKGVRQRRKSQSQNSSVPSPHFSQHPRRDSKASLVTLDLPLECPPESDGLLSEQSSHPETSYQTQHGMWDTSLSPHFEHSESWPTEQWHAEPSRQAFGGQPGVEHAQWLNGSYDQSIPGHPPEGLHPSISLDPALMEPSFASDISQVPDLNHSLTPSLSFNMFAPSAQHLAANHNLRVIQGNELEPYLNRDSSFTGVNTAFP